MELATKALLACPLRQKITGSPGQKHASGLKIGLRESRAAVARQVFVVPPLFCVAKLLLQRQKPALLAHTPVIVASEFTEFPCRSRCVRG